MARVPLDHLSLFTIQLSSMVNGQLPLDQVLASLSQETPHPVLRAAVEDMTDDVRYGMEFSEALSLHPQIFDELYVNTVRAGMISGRLDHSLARLAEFLTEKQRVMRQVRQAMTYPALMLLAFIGVFNGMVFVILPRFEQVFTSMGKELPELTKWVMHIGQNWRESWFSVLSVMAAVIGGWLVVNYLFNGRYLWHRFRVLLPMLGSVWRLADLTAFLKTLGVQLQNEVPLIHSLELAGGNSGNVYLAELVHLIADDVRRGENLASAIGRHAFFPRIVQQMVLSGDQSGNLAELILSTAGYFENMLILRIQTMTGLINPVLTITMAVVIGTMMMATFLPVFDLSSAMGSK
ncbi:MAG: type II secretion system F family protein [Magnetococcales bacterium]|nr:type II secretion system F family protein [Magnetococcales bacterium]